MASIKIFSLIWRLINELINLSYLRTTHFMKEDVVVGACPIEWFNNHFFFLDVDDRAEF